MKKVEKFKRRTKVEPHEPALEVSRVQEAILFALFLEQRDWMSAREIRQRLKECDFTVGQSAIYCNLKGLKKGRSVLSYTKRPTGESSERSVEMYQLTKEGINMIVKINRFNQRIRGNKPSEK